MSDKDTSCYVYTPHGQAHTVFRQHEPHTFFLSPCHYHNGTQRTVKGTVRKNRTAQLLRIFPDPDLRSP